MGSFFDDTAIGRFIKKLFVAETRKKIITKVDEEGRIENIEKDVQKDLAYKEGEIASLKAEVNQYKVKEQIEHDETEIAAKLLERAQKKGKLNYQGGLSLKALFKMLLVDKQNVDILSYDEKRVLGKLDDIGILPDGTMAIKISHKGKSYVPIVAQNPSQIFASYGGLKNVVGKGSLRINVTEKGEYFQDIMVEKVSKVVYVNGKMSVLSQSQDHLINLLASYEEEKQELLGQLVMTEDMVAKLTREKNVTVLGTSLNHARAQSAEVGLQENHNQIKGMSQVYNQLIRENSNMAVSVYINEARANALEDAQEKVLSKVSEILKKPELDLAKEQIEDVRSGIVQSFLELSHVKEPIIQSNNPVARGEARPIAVQQM